MRSGHRTPEEPIEDYLDELLSCLRLPPRATRRLLAETEDHLREAAHDAARAGADPVDAERAAVSRFGAPARIAEAASAARRPSLLASIGTACWAATVLSGVGLLAVGVSGALAAVFTWLGGARFVGALPQTYSLAVCGHFLTVQPRAGGCSGAAILENSHDAVALRLLAGIVGLALVGLAWRTHRYLNADTSFRRLLYGTISAVAALSFGAAAVVLLGMSVVVAVQHGSGGVGWYLSGGVVSLGAVLPALRGAWRHLRVLRPWRPQTIMGL